MAVIESKYKLKKELPNEILIEILSFFLDLGQHRTEISTWTVLHNYIDFGTLFVDYAIVILNNIFMIEFFQNVDFVDKLIFLLFAHGSVVDFLPDHGEPIRESPNFLNNSKLPLANIVEFLILIHGMIQTCIYNDNSVFKIWYNAIDY